MKFRLFQYPLPAPAELEDLNAYLNGHRVASVTQHLAQGAGGPLLVFVVQTVAEASPRGESRPGERVDYRQTLSEEEFAVFSRLRDERSKIASAEGVPVYTVFTNAQLARMVQGRPRNPEEMLAIEGIGKARVEKHASMLLPILQELQPKSEAGGGS